MSKVLFYKRYLYIIERLQSNPSNFQDLKNHILIRLQNDDFDINFEFSVRTFDRDKKDIFDLFGIIIQYNRKEKVYYIEEDLIEQSTFRIMEAFSIHQALKLSNKISSNVLLESRIPSGTQFINGLLYAIQNFLQISFNHTKFWDTVTTLRKVKPLAIKEAQHRWYLIAYDTSDKTIKNFGLDRISNLNISDIKFKPLIFNVQTKYEHAFGIETNEPPVKVILQFSWHQGKYIKAFPLHSSQKIIDDNNDFLLIELFIHPTYDFIMEIFKYGDQVIVIEPISIRNSIIEKANNMLRAYQFPNR
ncbi:WYL domain-containing protein [Flavobacterium davisii]|uniref:WYL domain-containing protein n=1 Tax=Flavobacterium davisii TaxID=2906077 RepID=A0ABW8PMN5_9FLAO